MLLTKIKRIATLARLGWVMQACAVGMLYAAAAPAQTLTTLHNFCSDSGCTDGENPYAGLVQGPNGDFYGTTFFGGGGVEGNNGYGTVFTITPSGKLTTLYSFCLQMGCPDGAGPTTGLVLGTHGNFYGTTDLGGAGQGGNVFEISPSGSLKIVYNFCTESACADGVNPRAALIQASDGYFYGTTYSGGAIDGTPLGFGTIFKMTPGGELTTIYTFCTQYYNQGGQCTDGALPFAGLVQSGGDFYGTTYGGGANGQGTVFKITPSGTLTTLYSFCSQSGCTDGYAPEGGLIRATDGNLYGTTADGGYTNGTACSLGCGTVYKVTASGKLTTLHRFDSKDGANPIAGLVQATNGDFYGTTSAYGNNNNDLAGTVFRLSTGFAPFVETVPSSAEVGATVTILGNDLTGATSVTFDGTAAALTVNASGTAISTTVPTGANSGTVQVVTPGGTLSSNVPFRVLP